MIKLALTAEAPKRAVVRTFLKAIVVVVKGLYVLVRFVCLFFGTVRQLDIKVNLIVPDESDLFVEETGRCQSKTQHEDQL